MVSKLSGIRLIFTLSVALLVCEHALAVSQGVPDASHIDIKTRQSMQLACIAQQLDGPVTYRDFIRAKFHTVGFQPVRTHTPRTRKGAPSILHDPGFWVLAIVAFIYLTPLLWVLLSSRSRGVAKFGWLLVTLFFSWLGLAVFLIVTQMQRARPDT